MKSRFKEVFVICCALVLKANAQTPQIISEPQSITVNNASAAAFTVVATNAATYQWYFQGTSILPGATNATLSLDDVATNQAGSYTVVVTSSNSVSVTSAPPAVLTIVPGTIVQWTISKYADGSSSNFLVQLFDHDKPATVQNFIHYITSGSYSNTFFDRDVTNFVLQGGDYASVDRSSTNQDVNSVSTGTNIFPKQVDNEFSVGPLIHNRFGTLTMALVQNQITGITETNSATGAFFFNLADNSASLDPQDFTVFGRILTGTNVLQYFNTLSPPSNGISTYFSGVVPTLPVDFDGTQEPMNNNFFYCDFAFQTTPPVDTTPPTVSITFPAPNEVFTNAGDLTVTGIASSPDNFGVAEVYCVLKEIAGVYAGQSETNTAIGTTDWSLDFGTNLPGVFELTAYAQDGAGRVSAPASEYFTNLATLTIVTNVNGELTTNHEYLVPGQTYSFSAALVAGEQFVDWQNLGVVSIDPDLTFTAETNFTLTVTYSLSTLPPGLAITSPAAGSVATATNGAFTISGTIPTSVTVTQVTVQLFSQSNAVTAALPALINGGNWSQVVSNMASGPYTILVVAADSVGQEGTVSENFTLHAPPIIFTQPTNVTALDGSTAVFSVVASNTVSYQWQLVGTGPIAGATNTSLALTDVTTNQSGSSYEVVLISSDGETNISTPAVLTVVTGTLVQITFSGYADGSRSNVLVQLYDHEKPATVANFLHYLVPVSGSGVGPNVAYSNMIWDLCLPNSVLEGGNYDATDQTNSTSPPHLQSILENFTQNLVYSPAFPFNVDNEYGVGPVLHNTFGTLAMAKTGGEPDSAANAFFFNLTDNSSNLDNANGGYTVFGRLISGSNVLQYFNTLSKPNEGIFDTTTISSAGSLPDLPVNYHGWTVPANSNLFFGTFTILSTYNKDTNPPTVVMNYPTNGQTVTNVDVVLQGTANDNVGLARVNCAFNQGLGNVNAVGTTNWAADLGALAPGNYTYRIVAQDGSGNVTSGTNVVTGSFVVPRYPFEAMVNGDGTLSTNAPNGTNTTVGAKYTITATPGKGATFVNWTMGSNTFLFPTTNFTMQNGLQMTANFITNTVRGGISFTYPTLGAELTNGNFSIRGKLGSTIGPAQVTCQLFAASTSNSISAPMIMNATNTWSTPAVSLAPGYYILQAVAQGINGRSAVVVEHFAILAKLNIVQYGQGKITFHNGEFLQPGVEFGVKATPAAGYSFLSWNAGGGSVPTPIITFVMYEGTTLTATFISNTLPNTLTFTSPKSKAQLSTNNVTLTGKIASSVAAPQVLCQVYEGSAPITGFAPATVSGGTWSLPLTNLGMGVYTAVAMASDATGRTTLASDEFLLNFYPTLAGNYHGLFFDPQSVSGTNAGAVSFSLNNNGVVSGNLTFPEHKPYLLYFQMGDSGSIILSAPGFTVPINLEFNFDFTNFTGEMTGLIGQGNEICTMRAYRAVKKLSTTTTPTPGTYVLNLEPVTPTNGILTGPLGDSFASVVASANGNMAVAGTMADDSTPFSFSTGVYTNGVWPVFASFYKGNGMLIGWETNLPSGVCTGSLYWVKSPTNGSYFTNGISEQLDSFGEEFVAPATGSNYQIVFGGGTLTSLVTNVFSFKGTVIVPAAGTTDGLTGTLTSKGVLKGSIVNPFNNEKLTFNGAFISPTNGGGGFTLDTGGQTGYFEIGQLPP
jgi:cyclophilin family peptidyl-prolyl cis-trans isomerase